MFPNWPAVNRGGRITRRAHIGSSATGMVASRGPRGGSSKWSCIKADIPRRIFMKILIIEDDLETAEFVAGGLQARGHVTRIAENGREGFEAGAAETFDVVVLDRMLPGLDGLSVVTLLRSEGVSTPVLFLTNLSGVDDRVEGLGAGGDDYLVKPFAFDELLARLEALARRPTLGSRSTVLVAGDLEIDLVTRTVRRGSALIDLQPREFRLLEVLMRNEGRLITRKMLLEQVWGFHFDPRTNIVETLMSRLRSKIDRGSAALIQTVRGAGYNLRAPE
jgi:two-component system, OmpR family, response regulator